MTPPQTYVCGGEPIADSLPYFFLRGPGQPRVPRRPLFFFKKEPRPALHRRRRDGSEAEWGLEACDEVSSQCVRL